MKWAVFRPALSRTGRPPRWFQAHSTAPEEKKAPGGSSVPNTDEENPSPGSEIHSARSGSSPGRPATNENRPAFDTYRTLKDG